MSNSVTFPSPRPRLLTKPTPKAEVPRSLSISGGARDVDSTEMIKQAAAQFSSAQITDPFQNFYIGQEATSASLQILAPEFPLERLALLCQEDTTLLSCIDAIATNTTGFGYSWEYIGPDDQKESAAAKAEKEAAQSILDWCNPDEGVQKIMEKASKDYNAIGHAYIEVGRDVLNNVVFIYHVPAQTMRVTAQEKNEQEIELTLMRNGRLIRQKAFKKFRRFVMLKNGGVERVYFKEFGDLRRIDRRTGDEIPKDTAADIAQEASEIIWLNRYCPGYVYGLPPYISAIPAILGSKEASLTNLDFFQENAIPALAVLVSGGMLSADSVDAIKDHFQRKRGRQSMHRAVVLEARVPEADKSDNPDVISPAPSIDIKPLASERQGDALFQEYTKNNSDQVRQAYRLPPIVIGRSDDYNRATSESAMDMAEAQVFGPQRALYDGMVNGQWLRKSDQSPMTFWRYRSNAARIAAPETKLMALESLEAVGAMTPNIAVNLANDMFGLQIPTIIEPWGDLPFALVKAMADKGSIAPETGFPEVEPPAPSPAPGATKPPTGTKPKPAKK